jgi:hypothetical protein
MNQFLNVFADDKKNRNMHHLSLVQPPIKLQVLTPVINHPLTNHSISQCLLVKSSLNHVEPL